MDSLNNNLKNNISNLTYKGNPISEDNTNRISKLPAAVVVDDVKVVIQADGNVGIVEIPEGLAVGDTVTYSPKGETYTWKAEYCSSAKTIGTGDVDIKSGKDEEGNDQAYNITSWKVLNINEDGTVDLIAANLTSGKVYLGEAQGYNNAVYLLNAACSKLYGDSSKGITARSVNIKDIEEKMKDEAITNEEGTGAHDYANAATYGYQLSSAYSSSNSKYPTIYAQENLSVINGTTNNSGIGMSEQNALIGRTDNGATAGKIATANSIQPYQTYWDKDNTFMQIAFKSEGDVNYYNLFMPNGSSKSYWVASRCVNTYSSYCGFGVGFVYSGRVSADDVYLSNGMALSCSRALCPIVTLNSKLLTGNHSDGWEIK